MVIFPNLQDAWFSIVDRNNDIVTLGSYIFRVGWQGFSGFRLTLHCTFFIIIILFLRYGGKIPMISSRQFFIFMIGCLAGNMFYGRSGLVVSIVLCLISFVYWNRKYPKRIITFIASAVAVIASISLLQYVPELNKWYN